MKKRILVTGGSGRFGSILKKLKTKHEMLFPSKVILDITNFKSIQKYIKLKKPNIVIHLAGLSRPMNIHDRQIQKSIDLNIIGTANVVKVCDNLKIKLIYLLSKLLLTMYSLLTFLTVLLQQDVSAANPIIFDLYQLLANPKLFFHP